MAYIQKMVTAYLFTISSLRGKKLPKIRDGLYIYKIGDTSKFVWPYLF